MGILHEVIPLAQIKRVSYLARYWIAVTHSNAPEICFF
ncbi:hypothetical protein ACPOL_2880 [Acidisarcina polymorpha]|uniref:Uncharacterized protein n=1 Tax=Acidisarcina polymorpha TaxID=2211140 RepID=A0A2Z5G0A1_9BACT|nr:hypothetical protein ACPOL_2880 [Acidisarcina polymorpha]